MDLFQQLSDTFWSEKIWTPPNITWAMYEERGYRKFNDMYYSVYSAFVLFVIRVILDRTIFIRLGVWLGLEQNKARPPIPNPVLEKVYLRTRGKLSDDDVAGLVKQLDQSERHIQRWMRLRVAFSRPTTLSKFTESAWRCVFYLVVFSYGVFILWDKPWMWDSLSCFQNYPHHQVTSDQWWYYNIEAGFYLSLLVSQFFDIQRKDFWVMFVHHVVSLCLLGFSWACNLYRIGTLVLVIHDFADVPLEFAKMMAYVKKQRLADITFNIFAVSWVLSRICFLPYRIIYYSSVVALDVVPMFPAYYIFNGLLIALQILHIIWTYFIVRMAIKSWQSTDGLKDIRSDDESEIEFDSSESQGTSKQASDSEEALHHHKDSMKKDSNDNDCVLVNEKKATRKQANGIVNGKC